MSEEDSVKKRGGIIAIIKDHERRIQKLERRAKCPL
jgi:hypothetical protein